MIRKTVRIGACVECGHDVMSHQVFLDDPRTIRGIQLAWCRSETGYWAACSNPSCIRHFGEGTLPERPRNMFPVDTEAPERLGERKEDLRARLDKALRGDWDKPLNPKDFPEGGELPGG